MASRIVVAPAGAEQLASSLALLYSHLPKSLRQMQIDRTLGDVGHGNIDLSGLLSARQQGRLVGVMLTVEQPGRAAMIWPPSVIGGVDLNDVADALLRAADERLAHRGIQVLQALLDPDDQAGARPLIRNGYARLTELMYLQRDVRAEPLPNSTQLRFVNFDSQREALFESVIEATYAGSLDAPELGAARSVSDAMAGHRAVGDFDPQRWLLALEDSNPVGCLLMAEHAELTAWEVVYLGVVPSVRGRGLGRELTLEALRRARSGGAQRLLLAVDCNNRPACHIYRQLDFEPWDRRSVFLRFLRADFT